MLVLCLGCQKPLKMSIDEMYPEYTGRCTVHWEDLPIESDVQIDSDESGLFQMPNCFCNFWQLKQSPDIG